MKFVMRNKFFWVFLLRRVRAAGAAAADPRARVLDHAAELHRLVFDRRYRARAADRHRRDDELRAGGVRRRGRVFDGVSDDAVRRVAVACVDRRACVLTALIALLLGMVTMRLSGHFLPLGTIAWGLALFYLFGNLEFLGKYDGINGIPVLNLFGWHLESGRSIYYLIWVVVLLAVVSVQNLLNSRPGRAIRALRGGGTMAEAMGVNTAWMRVVIFVYAAVLAAISGFLYAHLQRAVNPTPFGLNHGIEFLFMAVVGGVSHVWGAVLGATILTSRPTEPRTGTRPYCYAVFRMNEYAVSAAFRALLAPKAWPRESSLTGYVCANNRLSAA